MALMAISGESLNSFQQLDNDIGDKVLTDSSVVKVVPSKLNYENKPSALTYDAIPIVDYSAFTDPDRRSKALHSLNKACRDWGFFILVNHGVREELTRDVLTATRDFFNLPYGEKKPYEAKSIFNVSTTSNQGFRDFLKLYIHPQFHCPLKPQPLRDVLLEYGKITRKIAQELVDAACESIGLEKGYAYEALELDSTFQIFAANLYPPCPKPDEAIGIPAHTDPGLFTFLINNGVVGLQIQHNGRWIEVHSPNNSIMVNVADQLQIFSNGRYKSVKHRAVVNSERERMSIVVANGPSGEAVVGPAEPLVRMDGRPFYERMKYMDYVEYQVTKGRDDRKPILEQMMIQ